MSYSFRSPEADHPWILLRTVDDFGLAAYDLVRPPERFWSDGTTIPPSWRAAVDAKRVRPEPLPTELLAALPAKDTWSAMSRRSLDRLFAWFLVCEDPQRRLDVQPVATLAHQASLVHHIVQEPHLQSVLIADEVGLGKTIEAALLVKQLLATQSGLRVLYLAPARLVPNVRTEMERMGLRFRSWVAGSARDAHLEDQLVIASIHRAVVGQNFDEFIRKSRWDVIIVDECHHLSAWGVKGGSAARKYRLVNELRQKLTSSARLILLSGTPHQGHAERFENLLRLLCRQGEALDAVAGRVIFRTKESVRDWNGRPLFPMRRLNPPTVLDLGASHRGWLNSIHELFEPSTTPKGEQVRRAAGWRCGQALQWATSSIEAGIGFLVRQAMRAGWTPRKKILADALVAIRPYRMGPVDEPVHEIYDRIARELRVQADDRTVEDIEDSDDDEIAQDWVPDEAALAQTLAQGLALLESDRDTKWAALEPLLAAAGREKVVLFAQPIETVMALSRFLERTTGSVPALIIGNQSEQERYEQVASFWNPDGPQFLVSSRAGGEGLNLQVSRRLIHVDVPWNPMELEQRVGRVHRFLSRKTIIIDTLVVKNSREADMYEVARAKMHEVASSLTSDSTEFEALFSRVMSVVPPEELQNVLAEGAVGPLTPTQCTAVGKLVTDGFRNWQAFHQRFADREQRIKDLPPGEASWEDLERFATSLGNATHTEGHHAMAFEHRNGEVIESPIEARSLKLADVMFGIGDYAGMPILDEDGRPVRQLGLNTRELQDVLRAAAFPSLPVGAAHVRWPEDVPRPVAGRDPFGVLAVVRLPVRLTDSGAQELGPELHLWCVDGAQSTKLLRDEKALVVRGLLRAVVRREADAAPQIVQRMCDEQTTQVAGLRQPSDVERGHQIRFAVFPLLIAIVD